MAAYILHQGATVMCMHGGQASPGAPNPRVKVGGQMVVTQPTPYTVSGCSMPTPSAGNGPCVTGQFITGAIRVKVGGMPVLLQNSQAVCVPTGTGLNITVTQLRVKGT